MVVCRSLRKDGDSDSAVLMNWPGRISCEPNTASAGEISLSSLNEGFYGGSGEHALHRVDLQAILLKDGEDLPEMLVVLLLCAAADDEVVQVAEHER
jgi:hypothetical protein